MRLRPLDGTRMQTLTVWGLAAAIYIAIGVFFIEFLLSIFVAIGYLLVTTWLAPVAIRRWL